MSPREHRIADSSCLYLARGPTLVVQLLYLLPLAHSLEELKTIRTCGRKAMANARKVAGRFVFEGAQPAIDGHDQVTYQSLCAQCYFRYKGKAESENHPQGE